MKKQVFGIVAAIAVGLMAEDVTQERFGTLRCSFGGGITAGGLINYDSWGNSAQPTFPVSNMTGYVLSTRGNMFAKGRWTLGSDGAGGVTATNAFTMTKDVKSQAAGTRVYLPFDAFKGAAWRTDTGKSGVFPTNDLRNGLFTGKDVKRVTFATTGGAARCRFVSRKGGCASRRAPRATLKTLRSSTNWYVDSRAAD